jgi:uncharacterized small protein (DUF1192 family)
MDPKNLTERRPTNGVAKRTLRGLYGRVQQVESRVEAAYEGLNKAVGDRIKGEANTIRLDLYAMLKERDEVISALQSEIATLRNMVVAKAEADPQNASPS